jgi:hypothetical protein
MNDTSYEQAWKDGEQVAFAAPNVGAHSAKSSHKRAEEEVMKSQGPNGPGVRHGTDKAVEQMQGPGGPGVNHGSEPQKKSDQKSDAGGAYEQAWAEGDEKASPATNAVKSAAQAARDAQAKEFSEAFFADDPISAKADPTQVALNAATDMAMQKQAKPGDAPEQMTAAQSDEEEIAAAAKKAA